MKSTLTVYNQRLREFFQFVEQEKLGGKYASTASRVQLGFHSFAFCDEKSKSFVITYNLCLAQLFVLKRIHNLKSNLICFYI